MGNSAELLKDVIKQINSTHSVDFVIFSGDMIDRPEIKALNKFIETANTLTMPWYFTLGNHDTKENSEINKEKFFEIVKKHNPNIKTKKTSYAVKKGDFLLLFLDGVMREKYWANGFFSDKQLNWIEKQLKANPNKKVIIFQHFPVIEPFKSKSHKVLNADEYLSVIDKYKNVIAIITGHYHSSKITLRNNVAHISTPALVEYPNVFRIFEIENLKDKVMIKIETKETSLKNLQLKSKIMSKSWKLSEGKEVDKNRIIILKN